MHICFSSHCIVLFPLSTPASWRSAKYTRRLFKVWRNWPNSKLLCYSERGEPRLSFEYKFVGHPWKLLKLYPTVHAYLFFFTLYCIVSTEYTGKLKECEVHTDLLFERGEPRLSFEYKFVGHPWKLLKLYPTVHAYLFFFTLYCIVSTEYTCKLKECEVHTEAL